MKPYISRAGIVSKIPGEWPEGYEPHLSTALYLHFWKLLIDVRGATFDPEDYDQDTDSSYDLYLDACFQDVYKYRPKNQPPAMGYNLVAISSLSRTRAWGITETKQKVKIPLYASAYIEIRSLYSESNWFTDFKWCLGLLLHKNSKDDYTQFLTLSEMKKRTSWFAKYGVKMLTKRLTLRYNSIDKLYESYFGKDFPLLKYMKGTRF